MLKVLAAFTAIVTAVAFYSILPILTVCLNRSLREARSTVRTQPASRIMKRLSELIARLPIARLRQRLELAGLNRPDAVRRHVLKTAAAALIPFFASTILSRPAWQSVLAAVAGSAWINGQVEERIRRRKAALERSFYKVYRFIDSQMSAGIKATDAIKGLHESVDDPLIKPALIRFSARYALTLDLDQAMIELRAAHSGKDIETFGTQLRQVLATGLAGRSFLRTEELLFARYFTLLQKQSSAIRNRLLLSAILMMLPITTLFLMPLFYEAMGSLSSIFR